MALYSVWDWNRNAWRVYSTRRPASVGDDPIPPRPKPLSPVGCDPDTQVKPLPSGAKLEGFSHFARGEVRRMPGGLGDNGDDAGAGGGVTSNTWLMLGVGAALGAATVWWLGRKP